eukprot:441570_1
MGAVLSKTYIPSIIILASFPSCFLSANLDCSEAFECANQSIVANLAAYAYGYQSASGPSTTIRCPDEGARCYCTGAFSCYSTKSIVFADKIYDVQRNSFLLHGALTQTVVHP